MIRIVTMTGLLISLVFLVNGAIQTWQEESVPEQKIVARAKVSSEAVTGKVRFYPDPPVLLPNVRDGYLFNEERTLVEEAEEGADEKESAALVSVNMEELFYTGSIIVGEMRKGLISYTIIDASKPAVSSRRTALQRVRKRASSQATKKIALIDEGSDFHGYTVASVLPEKIVFIRGEEEIEKFLHDPAKKRMAPPPSRTKKSVPSSAGKRGGTRPLPPGVRTATQTRSATRSHTARTAVESSPESRPRVVTRRSRPVPGR